MIIVIATKNLHKMREFRTILAELKELDLVSLKNFQNYSEPSEDRLTFEENAALKAEHAAKTLSVLALADDSGLVVPALGGEPGIYSKRYAGPENSDKENRKKLLEKMRGMQGEARHAYFHCSLALSSPQGIIKCVSATVEGRIAEEERGGYGFGYDSLFIKHDYDKTFGELEDSIKNRMSHRRKALDKILPSLESAVKRNALKI